MNRLKSLVLITFIFLLITLPLSSGKVKIISGCYKADYVEVAGVQFKSDYYNVISMKKDSNKIKAKYFASRDKSGNSVYSRYTGWAAGKSTILVSSGTYMDLDGKPQGLTIDNGIPINETLISGKMDALVIVHSNGGITVSNLMDGDLTLQGGKMDPKRKLNLRKSSWDYDDFIEWSKNQGATVFQTHLLAYKNELIIKQPNTELQQNSANQLPRRFLAEGKNEKGKVFQIMVLCQSNSTLFTGARKALEFLKTSLDMEVSFMINLDTGNHDEFELRNADCSVNNKIKGTKPLNGAVNLLSYYFE